MTAGVAVVVLTLTGCGEDAQGNDDADGPITIGLSSAMSGPNSIYGTVTSNAINLAIKDVNADGGLLGRQIELVTYDDEFDPQKAQTNTRRLLTDDEVDVLFATAGSGTVMATVGLAAANNTLMFNTIGQADEITYPDGLDEAPYSNVFSTAVPNSVEAEFLAQAVPKVAPKVGLIGENTPYGQTSLDRIEQELTGGEVVGREAFDQGATNMTAQLLRLDEAGAEVILPVGCCDLVTLRKNMATLGMDQLVAGAGGLGLTGYYGVVGALANGDKFATPAIFAASGEYSPEAQAFADAYKAEFGNDDIYGKGENPQPTFGIMATRTYQAMEIYLAAVEEAGTVEPGAVREVLESGDEFETVDGAVSFSTDDHYAFTTDNLVLDTIVVAGDGTVTFEQRD
jgi:branched-chain amino acid transport system substrate-binding protein